MLKKVFGSAKQLLSNFKDMRTPFAQNLFSYKRPLNQTEVNHSSKFFIGKILMVIDTPENDFSPTFTEDPQRQKSPRQNL